MLSPVQSIYRLSVFSSPDEFLYFIDMCGRSHWVKILCMVCHQSALSAYKTVRRTVKIAAQNASKIAILRLKMEKNFLGRGHSPSPIGDGDIPSPRLTPLGASIVAPIALEWLDSITGCLLVFGSLATALILRQWEHTTECQFILKSRTKLQYTTDMK